MATKKTALELVVRDGNMEIVQTLIDTGLLTSAQKASNTKDRRENIEPLPITKHNNSKTTDESHQHDFYTWMRSLLINTIGIVVSPLIATYKLCTSYCPFLPSTEALINISDKIVELCNYVTNGGQSKTSK